jgi:hypothetical protein
MLAEPGLQANIPRLMTAYYTTRPDRVAAPAPAPLLEVPVGFK